jgi:hypothetical protein
MPQMESLAVYVQHASRVLGVNRLDQRDQLLGVGVYAPLAPVYLIIEW